MTRTAINAPGAAAIAPYSHAVDAGEIVFFSGQTPLVPMTGKLVPGSIAEQTEQVFRNLGSILEEAGSGLDRLVKTTVFLADFGDFQAMNEVYSRYAGETPPARATVEVAALPSDAKVEIEAVALL